MKQLSASETSTAIQARIHGLQINQVEAVNRLRRRDIPEDMILAAAKAHETPGTPDDQADAYEVAESAIITHIMHRKGVPADEAVRYLNGVTPMDA